MKCPKCEKTISDVKGEFILVKTKQVDYEAVAHICGQCSTIISVEANPFQLIGVNPTSALSGAI